VRVIADLAGHQGTPENLREKVGEILEPAPATASVPATQRGDETLLPAVVGSSAEERLALTRQAMERDRILLEGQAQNVRDQRKLLEDRRRLLEEEIQKFEAEKRAFEPKVTTADDKAKAENFQTILALYDELKPRQVKDLMYNSTDLAKEELAAAFLTAMDTSRAGKIIAEFKTEKEREWINSVLKHIRTAGTSSASGVRTGGDVAAVPK